MIFHRKIHWYFQVCICIYSEFQCYADMKCLECLGIISVIPWHFKLFQLFSMMCNTAWPLSLLLTFNLCVKPYRSFWLWLRSHIGGRQAQINQPEWFNGTCTFCGMNVLSGILQRKQSTIFKMLQNQFDTEMSTFLWYILGQYWITVLFYMTSFCPFQYSFCRIQVVFLKFKMPQSFPYNSKLIIANVQTQLGY